MFDTAEMPSVNGAPIAISRSYPPLEASAAAIPPVVNKAIRGDPDARNASKERRQHAVARHREPDAARADHEQVADRDHREDREQRDDCAAGRTEHRRRGIGDRQLGGRDLRRREHMQQCCIDPEVEHHDERDSAERRPGDVALGFVELFEK